MNYGIVAKCPVCTAPIYGQEYISSKRTTEATVMWTCSCQAKLQAKLDAEILLMQNRAEAAKGVVLES